MSDSVVRVCENSKVTWGGCALKGDSCQAVGDHQFLVFDGAQKVSDFYLCNAHFRVWHDEKRKGIAK